MFRNDDPTVVASLPSDTTPTGTTPGFFTAGNPATGTPGTIVPDWWLNMVQEELLEFVTVTGGTPAKGNFAQVSAAVAQMARGQVVRVTPATSGAQSVPSWASSAFVRVWGAGGGGGGSSGNGSGGSAGGGGGYADGLVTGLTPGGQLSATAGAGGTGGAAGTNVASGTNGGQSSVGAAVVCGGGIAGAGGNGGIVAANAAGGSATFASGEPGKTVTGEFGGIAVSFANGVNQAAELFQAAGGGSEGNGPQQFATGAANAALNGRQGYRTGQGGNGGISGGVGGNGADGLVIIEWRP